MTEKEKYVQCLTTVFTRDNVQVMLVRIAEPDGTYKLRLHVQNDDKLESPLEFSTDEMRTKILKIKNYSVPFDGIEIAEIITNINSSLRENKCQIIDRSHNLGWQIKDHTIVGWKSAASFDMQGNPTVKDIYGFYPSYSGDLNENIKELQTYISTHGAAAQSILLYGFSAILFGYFNKSLLLSIAGKSSRGKTTLARFIVSLFGNPDNEKLNTTFNVTLNKMSERLDNIYGTAVLIDDLSLAPYSVKKDLESMIYILESGKEKDRVKTKSFSRDPAKWATTIIFSAEESILSQCDPEKEGIVGRLMELNISSNDLFDNAEDATSIAALSQKHYGLLADEFVKRLLVKDKLSQLPALYDQKVSAVRNDYSGPMARISENVSLVLLTGDLLKELLDLPFDLQNIQNYLMCAAQENLENFRMGQKQNIILSKIYPELLEYGRKVCPLENQKFTDRVVISSKFMKAMLSEIQSEFGYKPSQVKQALKDGGVLLTNDSQYSYTATINGQSFRGTCLLIKNHNEVAEDE